MVRQGGKPVVMTKKYTGREGAEKVLIAAAMRDADGRHCRARGQHTMLAMA